MWKWIKLWIALGGSIITFIEIDSHSASGVMYDAAKYEKLTNDWDNECGMIAYNFLSMPEMNPTPRETSELCRKARGLYFPDGNVIDSDGSADDITTVLSIKNIILMKCNLSSTRIHSCWSPFSVLYEKLITKNYIQWRLGKFYVIDGIQLLITTRSTSKHESINWHIVLFHWTVREKKNLFCLVHQHEVDSFGKLICLLDTFFHLYFFFSLLRISASHQPHMQLLCCMPDFLQLQFSTTHGSTQTREHWAFWGCWTSSQIHASSSCSWTPPEPGTSGFTQVRQFTISPKDRKHHNISDVFYVSKYVWFLQRDHTQTSWPSCLIRRISRSCQRMTWRPRTSQLPCFHLSGIPGT